MTLLFLASSGDLKTLQTILHPSPSQTLHSASITPSQILISAIPNRHTHIITYCITTLGANINDFEVRVAVIQANSLAIYQTVVPAGFSLNSDHGGMIGGPLCWVGNDVPLATYLISQGANPNNDIQSRRYQPLAIAARNPNGSLKMIDLLVRHEAQIDRSGALILAAQIGKMEAVTYLLDKGANVNLCGWRDVMIFTRLEEAESALHGAVKGGHEGAVRLLLERGADAGMKNGKGQTALDLARDSEKEIIIRLLSSHGEEQT